MLVHVIDSMCAAEYRGQVLPEESLCLWRLMSLEDQGDLGQLDRGC